MTAQSKGLISLRCNKVGNGYEIEDTTRNQVVAKHKNKKEAVIAGLTAGRKLWPGRKVRVVEGR